VAVLLTGVRNGRKYGTKSYIAVRNAEEVRKVTTANKILQFYKSLPSDWILPPDIELLYPFDQPDTWDCVTQFYNKYFNDDQPRTLILGINPGRFGAGVTGIPFTDPKTLLEECNIDNPFPKKYELSAIFIYEIIDAYGGKERFYNDFFISSVCPLGFIKNGVNINYYDEKPVSEAVKPHIVEMMHRHIEVAGNTQRVYSLGKGLNYKFLKKLNDEHAFFDEVIPLPHPRWVMQYRRKSKDVIRDEIIDLLKESSVSSQSLD
jgi:hypothetical protein